tara:strand:- start:74 stop:1132 length:1059 start_codon:yes stop_codon:yes gene_type:complete
MTYKISELADLGWHTFFSSQLDTKDLDAFIPVKVIEVHRSNLRVVGQCLDRFIPPFYPAEGDEEAAATVGDWLLLDAETFRPVRLLERKSLFKRRAAGTGRKLQLIAANVETLFIVSSCNQDFNIPRLERYLVLAKDAGVTPIILLTKADLTDTPEDFASQARQLQPGLLVETVNALDPDSVDRLSPWCAKGQTIALLGSSGVGKSTLVNTLSGTATIATQGIREDDDKGRHTTTGRALHRLPQGGWLLDTPGMRELQLTDVASGLDDVFADIRDLARQCRFSDCRHESEPGCAVLAAIENGELDADRLKRWRKLVAEEAYNTESLAERHARDRAFGKMVKNAKQQKQRGDF